MMNKKRTKNNAKNYTVLELFLFLDFFTTFFCSSLVDGSIFAPEAFSFLLLFFAMKYTLTVTQTQHSHIFYRHSKVCLRVSLNAYYSFQFCGSARVS